MSRATRLENDQLESLHHPSRIRQPLELIHLYNQIALWGILERVSDLVLDKTQILHLTCLTTVIFDVKAIAKLMIQSPMWVGTDVADRKLTVLANVRSSGVYTVVCSNVTTFYPDLMMSQWKKSRHSSTRKMLYDT